MTTMRTVVVASLLAIAAGVISGLIAALVTGELHLLEALSGGVLGAAFFAISGVVVATARLEDLKSGLLMAYVAKASLLASIGLLIAFVDLHRTTFAIAIVTAAFAYLAAVVVTGIKTPRASAD